MRTNEVIANMLTTSTGKHMLDSGGAYGRHWERNQTEAGEFDDPVEAFEAREPWNVDVSEYNAGEILVTTDVYHFLCGHVQFAPEIDEQFMEFADDYDGSWLDTAEAFVHEQFPRAGGFHEREGSPLTWNSYNEESTLSQTLQAVICAPEDEHENIIMLQIHQGCDVRGGYTRPVAFRGDAVYLVIHHKNVNAQCANREHLWLSENAGYSFHSQDRESSGLDDYPSVFVRDFEPEECGEPTFVVNPETDTAYCPECLHDAITEARELGIEFELDESLELRFMTSIEY